MVLHAALLPLLWFAPPDAVEPWVQRLSHPHPEVRNAAERVLSELGESAAVVLEKTRFKDPDSSLRVARLLAVLRPLSMEITGGDAILPTTKNLSLVCRIRNPSPKPRTIRLPGFGRRGNIVFLRGRRRVLRRAASDGVWNFPVSAPSGTRCTVSPVWGRGWNATTAGQITIQPGQVFEIPLMLQFHNLRAGTVRLKAKYDYGRTRLRASFKIEIADLTLANLPRFLQSNDPVARQSAVLSLFARLARGELERTDGDPAENKRRARQLRKLMLDLTKSRFVDVRRKVVELVQGDRHPRFDALLYAFARDRDAVVQSRALHLVLKNFLPDKIIRPTPEVLDLYRDLLTHASKTRRLLAITALAAVFDSRADRVAPFLARLLEARQDPELHKEIQGIVMNRLRMGLGLDPVTGLIPPNDIAQLRRRFGRSRR